MDPCQAVRKPTNHNQLSETPGNGPGLAAQATDSRHRAPQQTPGTLA